MKKALIIYVVIVLSLYAVLTNSDSFMKFYLKRMATSMGFTGKIYFDKTSSTSYYASDGDFILLAEYSRAVLAHEIEHAIFNELVYENQDREANDLIVRLQQCRLGGISAYADTYACYNNNSCRDAYNETLAEVARLNALSMNFVVPAEWESIYQEINTWYAKK